VRLTNEHGSRSSGSDGESAEDLLVFSVVNDENGRQLRSRRQSTGSGATVQDRAF
jgi:hypothetical protein